MTGPKSNQAPPYANRSSSRMPQHARTWARWLTRKVGVILPQPRPFPESVAVGGNGPGDRFAAVEPVEHFHQRRDRPDVALGDELASSALNLAKANPRLRPAACRRPSFPSRSRTACRSACKSSAPNTKTGRRSPSPGSSSANSAASPPRRATPRGVRAKADPVVSSASRDRRHYRISLRSWRRR